MKRSMNIKRQKLAGVPPLPVVADHILWINLVTDGIITILRKFPG